MVTPDIQQPRHVRSSFCVVINHIAHPASKVHDPSRCRYQQLLPRSHQYTDLICEPELLRSALFCRKPPLSRFEWLRYPRRTSNTTERRPRSSRSGHRTQYTQISSQSWLRHPQCLRACGPPPQPDFTTHITTPSSSLKRLDEASSLQQHHSRSLHSCTQASSSIPFTLSAHKRHRPFPFLLCTLSDGAVRVPLVYVVLHGTSKCMAHMVAYS